MYCKLPEFVLLVSWLSVMTHAAPCAPPVAGANAIYFLTNDQTNAVVALPIAGDGTLSNGTVTPTGGAGSNSIDGKTNQPAISDALVGQSALTVAGQVSHPPCKSQLDIL